MHKLNIHVEDCIALEEGCALLGIILVLIFVLPKKKKKDCDESQMPLVSSTVDQLNAGEHFDK